MFKNLPQFIEALEKAGELVRIQEPVSPILEIAQVTDQVSKMPGGGKALLFENPTGHSMPVLINAFGSYKRMAMAMGGTSIEEAARRIQAFLDLKDSEGITQKLKALGMISDLSKIPPKLVQQGACQERVILDNIRLSELPILKCWPKDAERFITLPLVITQDPESGERNLGVYRMQIVDETTTLMHWQTQKDGATHAQKRRSRSEKVPVAVVIGADPATVFSGVVPLPYGVDELLFAGFLRNKAVEVVRCKTIDLQVPAEAEIVLEGFVDPEDLRVEGPFGDHTGVYTPPELFPAFHIQCITMKKKPVYLTTLVGKPPMEDWFMGKAIERTFLPILKKQIPELVDMNFPMEGTFNNAVIVSIDKSYPYQARKVAHAIWGLGQLALTKFVIVVDKTVDAQDLSAVALAVFNNCDPKRDFSYVEGPVDTLNHAAPARDFGSKVCMDATAKMKEEGYTRVWPEEIVSDPQVQERVKALKLKDRIK